MNIAGPVPDWLLSFAAAATLFAVMFDLGLSAVPKDFRWVIERPRLMARALFSVLVAVPVIAWIVVRAFDVPHFAEVGIMLMAISPGAPVALRRTLRAGGHAAFAQALHIALAIIAILSMPLGIAALDEYYGGATTIDPRDLARQVFVVQLLPLGLGMLARRFWHTGIRPFEPAIRTLASLLRLTLVVLVLVDVWETIGRAGVRVAAAVIAITMLSLPPATGWADRTDDAHGDRHIQRRAQRGSRAAGRDAQRRGRTRRRSRAVFMSVILSIAMGSKSDDHAFALRAINASRVASDARRHRRG